MQMIWIQSLEKKWQPIPVFLPGKSHGQRSLASYSPWGHKELDTTWQLNKYNKLVLYNKTTATKRNEALEHTVEKLFQMMINIIKLP